MLQMLAFALNWHQLKSNDIHNSESAMANSLIPIVETTRGLGEIEHIENLHFGSIAVVDTKGKLLASAGDPDYMTFSRSTIKPFQISPLVNDGGVEEFGLTSEELAVMCSSHSGEDFHLRAVQSILDKTESKIEQLQCGAHAPYVYDTLGQEVPRDVQWTALHNNCSGKHSGMLGWCQLQGINKDKYLEIEHPLQQAIRRNLSIWCDCKESHMQLGIDGCSAPNYALPLRSLALGFARLADAKGGETARTLFSAMTDYPNYVSGTGRNDLVFMQAGQRKTSLGTKTNDWVAKIGAEGVQLIGVRSAGIGIALKIVDGNRRALIAATIETLRQLDLLKRDEFSAVEEATDAQLAKWAYPSIKNVRGTVVGHVRTRFALTHY